MLSFLFSLPPDSRLWITTPIALLVSAVLVTTILYVDAHLEARAPKALIAMVARLPLPAALTAVLYMEMLFLTGYLGYVGPANASWGVGLPVAATILAFRGKMRRAALSFPAVFILSWVATGMLSAFSGLPLD
jgi:hypothetical protein